MPRTGYWLTQAIVAVLIQACATPRVELAATATVSSPAQSASPAPILSPVVRASPEPLPGTPTMTPAAAMSPEAVTVTAATGNLFIRRGPDLAFNPIAVLRKGQSARATGRDVLARWLQIAVAGAPGTTGWISIESQFTVVRGEVSNLPEIEPTEWPALAYLRNCTYHEMVADPGGIVIPPLREFPQNEVRVNPGEYRISDSDVDGHPEVLKVEIGEGSAIDIRVDGSGEKRKCPVP